MERISKDCITSGRSSAHRLSGRYVIDSGPGLITMRSVAMAAGASGRATRTVCPERLPDVEPGAGTRSKVSRGVAALDSADSAPHPPRNEVAPKRAARRVRVIGSVISSPILGNAIVEKEPGRISFEAPDELSERAHQ